MRSNPNLQDEDMECEVDKNYLMNSDEKELIEMGSKVDLSGAEGENIPMTEEQSVANPASMVFESPNIETKLNSSVKTTKPETTPVASNVTEKP